MAPEEFFFFCLGKKFAGRKSLKGKGRLTVEKYDVIQNSYARAVRDNKGNAENMSQSVMAILKHYRSTTEKLIFGCCPFSANSWCSYQRSIATGYKTH